MIPGKMEDREEAEVVLHLQIRITTLMRMMLMMMNQRSNSLHPCLCLKKSISNPSKTAEISK